uniref:Uncharacterized protein n=1 Tax=Oryza brachyantha TaxID=4533 RepID=J3MP34_ORYBR
MDEGGSSVAEEILGIMFTVVVLGLAVYSLCWEIELAEPLKQPSWLVGLAITGHGMGVFFAGGPPVVVNLGDLGVYFITVGLVVIVTGCAPKALPEGDDLQMAAGALSVYISVLVVATYVAGDWEAPVIGSPAAPPVASQ